MNSCRLIIIVYFICILKYKKRVLGNNVCVYCFECGVEKNFDKDNVCMSLGVVLREKRKERLWLRLWSGRFMYYVRWVWGERELGIDECV